MSSASKAFYKALRERVAGEQNWRCCYCGVTLDQDTVTFEHVMPQASGGLTRWENAAAACKPCNNSVGRMNAWIVWQTSGSAGLASIINGRRFK